MIFVIRTRTIPFWRNRPSRLLALSMVAVVAAGTVLPVSPLADRLGFRHPTPGLLTAIALLVIAYLALAEIAKREFYIGGQHGRTNSLRSPPAPRIHRRAAAFSHHGPLAARTTEPDKGLRLPAGTTREPHAQNTDPEPTAVTKVPGGSGRPVTVHRVRRP